MKQEYEISRILECLKCLQVKLEEIFDSLV